MATAYVHPFIQISFICTPKYAHWVRTASYLHPSRQCHAIQKLMNFTCTPIPPAQLHMYTHSWRFILTHLLQRTFRQRSYGMFIFRQWLELHMYTHSASSIHMYTHSASANFICTLSMFILIILKRKSIRCRRESIRCRKESIRCRRESIRCRNRAVTASFLMAEKNPNWWKRKIPTNGREKSQLMEEKNPNCDYLWKWKVSDAKGKVSDAEGKVSDAGGKVSDAGPVP